MNDKLTIFLILNDHQESLRLSAARLKSCSGIQDCKLIILPTNTTPSIINLALKLYDFMNVNVSALSNNLASIADYKSHHGDFCLVIDNDVLLSRDALSFFNACNDLYKHDDRVIAVSGFNTEGAFDPHLSYAVKRTGLLVPIGWAFWRSKSKALFSNDYMTKSSMFSTPMVLPDNKKTIYPHLPRTRHVNALTEEHATRFFHKSFFKVEVWSGLVNLDPSQSYHELPIGSYDELNEMPKRLTKTSHRLTLRSRRLSTVKAK